MQRAGVPGVQQQISRRRIAALVIAIGGHIGLGLLLLRPPPIWRSSMKRSSGTTSVLELRFIRTSRALLEPPTTIVHPEPRSASNRISLAKPSAPSRAISLMSRHGSQSNEMQTASGRLVVRIPDARGVEGNPGYDRGFMARLRAAKRADVVHGVPGSDASYVPGIHLIDPMDQGIGAVLRKAQRAFGITSSHCIDVDVWSHLTPEQLSARHVSPRDVARVEARYHCNEPSGLHF